MIRFLMCSLAIVSSLFQSNFAQASDDVNPEYFVLNVTGDDAYTLARAINFEYETANIKCTGMEHETGCESSRGFVASGITWSWACAMVIRKSDGKAVSPKDIEPRLSIPPFKRCE